VKDRRARGGPRLREAPRDGVQPPLPGRGGGLGVDYDGSRTSFEASMNYTVTEYANDVVYNVAEICAAEGVPAADPDQRVGTGAGRLSQHGPPRGQRAERDAGRGRDGDPRRRPRRGEGPRRDLPQHHAEEPPRVPARRGGDARRPPRPLRPRLPVAPGPGADRAARPPDRAQGARVREGGPVSCRGVRGPPEAPRREVHRELQRVPVDSPTRGPWNQLFPTVPIHRHREEAHRPGPRSCASRATRTARSTASPTCAT